MLCLFSSMPHLTLNYLTFQVHTQQLLLLFSTSYHTTMTDQKLDHKIYILDQTSLTDIKVHSASMIRFLPLDDVKIVHIFCYRLSRDQFFLVFFLIFLEIFTKNGTKKKNFEKLEKNSCFSFVIFQKFPSN